MKSIIQREKQCWICGAKVVHDHHIFGGPNRHLSEKYGLKVWLCPKHHTGLYGVHGRNQALMKKLRKTGQRAFERRYPDLDFLSIFGKNYSDE